MKWSLERKENMAKIVMGYWDCQYCGSVKIKGTLKECPCCGHPKDSSVRHYMSGEVEYLDADEAKNYGHGADWHCAFCDSMNSYKDTTCTKCGATRSESSKNYFQLHNISSNDAIYTRKNGKVEKVTEDKKIPVPEIVSDIEKSGWECKYCNTMNPKENTSCEKCGASKDGYDKYEDSYGYDKHEDTYSYDESENDKSTNSYTESLRSDDDFLNKKVYHHKDTIFDKILRNKDTILKFLSISTIAIAFIALLVFIFMPRVKSIEVQKTTWQYTVNIEDYKTYVEDGWSIPAGGREISHETRIRTYEQVLDHYETKTRTYTEQVFDHYDTEYYYSDNGDGTFTEHSTQTPVYRTETRTETYQEPVYRSEPVYDTYYTYEIERWKYARSVVTTGNDKEPYYGELNLASNERKQNTVEKYSITGYVKEDEEIKTYSVSYEFWSQIEAGRTIIVKVSAGQIIEIIE